MKKIILLLAFLTIGLVSYGQSKDIDEKQLLGTWAITKVEIIERNGENKSIEYDYTKCEGGRLVFAEDGKFTTMNIGKKVDTGECEFESISLGTYSVTGKIITTIEFSGKESKVDIVTLNNNELIVAYVVGLDRAELYMKKIK